MRYCGKCGHRQSIDGEVCEECGAKLDQVKPRGASQLKEQEKVLGDLAEYSDKAKVITKQVADNLKDKVNDAVSNTDFKGLKAGFAKQTENITNTCGGFFSKFIKDPKFQEMAQVYRDKGLKSALNLINIFPDFEEQYAYFFKLLKAYYYIVIGVAVVSSLVNYLDIPVLSGLIYFVAIIIGLLANIIYYYVYIYSLVKTKALILFLKYLGVVILGNIIMVVVCSVLFFVAPLIALAVFLSSLYINRSRFKILWGYKRYLLYFIVLDILGFLGFWMGFMSNIASYVMGAGHLLMHILLVVIINLALYYVTKWIFTQEKARGKSLISTLMMLTFLPILTWYSLNGYLECVFKLKDKEFYTENLLSKVEG